MLSGRLRSRTPTVAVGLPTLAQAQCRAGKAFVRARQNRAVTGRSVKAGMFALSQKQDRKGSGKVLTIAEMRRTSRAGKPILTQTPAVGHVSV
jgi:hypothetical protein